MVDTPHIFRSPNPDEYWMGERIFVREVMNTPEEPELSLAICRVPVGTTTQCHSLSVTEWYIIETGCGTIEIDGKKAHMSVGDCVKIKAGQSQRITNTGEADLVFQSLCRPRFTPGAYTNLEDEHES
ncbi:MAG TPA: cupin domain-containing protein [Hellea balneolensis]|uniref:Cupin domain-containing protein n=1 Tax=Hellea balneolensis TaxID=287478 RepID=A0A7C5QRX4_9PROT|nr:cupin domain-containing protein [Hellea balneolensis]